MINRFLIMFFVLLAFKSYSKKLNDTEHELIWRKCISVGELRIWNTWDAIAFLNMYEESLSIKELWISNFDSFNSFREEIFRKLENQTKIEKLRIEYFTINNDSNTFWKNINVKGGSLQSIFISNSKLDSTIFENFININNLSNIILVNNNIKDITYILSILSRCSNLESVNFSKNPIIFVPKNFLLYGNIKFLDFSYTKIKEIPLQELLNSNIKGIHVFGCKLKKMKIKKTNSPKCMILSGSNEFLKQNRKILKQIQCKSL